MKKILKFSFLFLAVFAFGNLVFADSVNITQINFTSDPQSVNINTNSAVLTVQTQDATGMEQKFSETNHLIFSSTSTTGEFSNASISEKTCTESTWSKNLTLTLASNSANKGFCYRDSTPGTYTLTVSAEGQSWTPAIQDIVITEEEIISDPVPDPVSITLKIYAGDTVLFNGPKTVTACAESLAINAPMTVNGKCAIEQSGLSNTWTWNYAPSGWLDELGGYTTTSDFSKFWSWFKDLKLGGTGLNQHNSQEILEPLHAGEELLLTYNSYPLRISASPNSGTVGDTITFSVEEESTFNPNPPFDMLWTPSLGATVTLGTQSCATIADGTCSIILNTVGSLNAIGSKTLFVPSAFVGITISESGGGGGGGGGGNPPAPTFSVPNALSYLKNTQGEDGSFGNSDLYTDWAGIALGAGSVTDSSRDKILSYFNSHNTLSSLLTDNERHAMALLALGQNPYSFNGINYIDAITSSFDGTQFGDVDLVNDDIFALIPLASAGYTVNDEMITKDIAFIISKQKTNGSWEESVDITAAAIQALKSFESVTDVSSALVKATNYLTKEQNNDGGWGNVSSTSWAMQAMSALDASWKNSESNKTGLDYLATQQAKDGAVSPSSETLQNRIWATSYAIAGASLKPWSAIMQSVSKPVSQTNSQSGSNNSSSGRLENTNLNPSTDSTNSPQANSGPTATPTSPVICPKGDLFSATTGQACTMNASIEDSTIGPQTSIIPMKREPAKISALKNKKITATILQDLPVDTNTLPEIIPNTLVATAINTLPIERIPKSVPIILGTISGLSLLYLAFKFIIKAY